MLHMLVYLARSVARSCCSYTKLLPKEEPGPYSNHTVTSLQSISYPVHLSQGSLNTNPIPSNTLRSASTIVLALFASPCLPFHS